MSGCIAPFLHTPSLLEQGEFYSNVADLCPRWTTLIRGSKDSDCKSCRVVSSSSAQTLSVLLCIYLVMLSLMTSAPQLCQRVVGTVADGDVKYSGVMGWWSNLHFSGGSEKDHELRSSRL